MPCGVKQCKTCPRQMKQCQMIQGQCPECYRKEEQPIKPQHVFNQPHINQQPVKQ